MTSTPRRVSHIVKPEPLHLPGAVANEATCLALARSIGLTLIDPAVEHFGHRPTRIVKHYDQVRVTGLAKNLSFLHLEDGSVRLAPTYDLMATVPIRQ
jgi:serine/threonine-protein kinase HipA